ncbi:MAG: 30S ribosomal protein S1 [Victivallales bacterium]|nr:30S ribosomal protein S1 [Victivallales bacterium]
MSKETTTNKLNEIGSLPTFLDLENMPSMDQLLSETKTENFTEGSIITGKIAEKKDNGVLIDIGCKAEGFISKEEIPNWEDISENDKIDIFLEEIENEMNQPVLSIQKAVFIKNWKNVTSKYNEGDIVKGIVKHRVKGGLIVDVEGVESFLPGSQIDIAPVKNMDELLGQEFELKIVKINEERKNIVVSRRELLEASRADKREKMLKEMEKGKIYKGTVKNITDFGAFIDLGGVDGLLHITDMSWGRITHPSEMLEVGQEIEVMILDIDYEKERVSLGYKQKTPNPWETVAKEHPVGSKIKGKVVNIMPYGAFIEIQQGIEGLIHVSEMSWTKRISRASDFLNIGEEVEAVILDIQPETKKISLGLRQTTENPWEVLSKKYPVGSRIKGKVRNMTSYGAFIEIENDIDGMIHVSDMSWTRKINNPAELLKVGDEVETVILAIDPDQQRISLGMKQLEEDPWENIEKLYKIGDIVNGKVSKITAFGAFIELSHKIDGLIHVSQISDEHIEKVKDVLKVGDEVEARVIKIDKADRRIGLSIKATKKEYSKEDLTAVGEEVSQALKSGETMVGISDALNSSDLDKLSQTAKEEETNNS